GADWEACAEFLSRNKETDFEPDDRSRLTARALGARPRSELAALMREEWDGADIKAVPHAGTQTPHGEYEVYFGFLHAHSHFSLDADQSGTLEEAYATARDAGGLDF